MPTKRALKESAWRLGVSLAKPVSQSGVWWRDVVDVDRTCPEWQAIEAAADWSNASADDLFAMAEQRDAIRSGMPAKPATWWQRAKSWFGA